MTLCIYRRDVYCKCQGHTNVTDIYFEIFKVLQYAKLLLIKRNLFVILEARNRNT